MTQKPAQRVLNYYGSKYRLARYYDAPQHKTIIEPFAGSASYALHYHWHDVRLYDAYERVCAVWDYVIKADPDEIRKLPLIEPETHVYSLPIAQEAKWLIGWWTNIGTYHPVPTLSKWAVTHWRVNGSCTWTPKRREMIAQTSALIKHWTITNASYDTIDNTEATWFVDPPYQCKAGRRYPVNAVDFDHLATWCRERSGQVQVCENSNSEAWLPFEPFKTITGANRGTTDTRKKTTEVIWRNYEPDTLLTLI